MELMIDVDAANFDGTTPGATYTVMGEEVGFDLYAAASFVAQVTVHQTPGGTTPTLDVRIEHSADRASWATLYDCPQIVAGSGYPKTYVFPFPTPGNASTDVKAWGRYVRITYKVGGTTPEWVVTGKIMGKE
jgi:hypothetical protein